MEAAFPHTDRLVELPSIDILICSLQKYRKERNLISALCIHRQICGHGLEAHTEVGNYLVPIFVDCGSMFDAHRVFLRLARRKEYSWTSVIQGYVEDGKCELATDMLQQMREDCVEPSRFTFVALLKACAMMKNAVQGQEIHDEIAKEGFEGDSFVGNTLVDMYAKCSLLYEAQDVFDSLSSQDIVSWNALMAGYADNGDAEEVLKCRDIIKAEGFHMDEVTYLWCVKACGSIGAINIGRELHCEIAKGEFNSHPFLCNALLDMYAKCGCLAEAQEVFDEMPAHGIVSWTAIIAGYAEQGLGDEALTRLDEMRMEGILPNTVTFLYGLKSCGSLMEASRGRETHSEIVIRGFEKDSFLGSNLVDMYARCGSILEARKVFDKLPVRDVVSWNAIISGYAEKGFGKQGLECLEKLQLEGLFPNANTLACSLKACSSIGAIKEGLKLHIRILKEGFDSFYTMGSCLVDLYSKCGWLAEAWEEFTKLSPVQDVQLWSCLILGYVEQGDSENALTMFAHMQEQGLPPDNGIFASIIKTCGDAAALEIGKRFHSQVCRSNFFDSVIGIALIDMYSRCGGMTEKDVIFDMMPHMDVVKWTALITGYARHGETDLVLTLFEQMREEGIDPNEITFLSVLSTCTHAGLVEKGRKYYESMRKEYGITPTMKHYNCMLDLFIRAGQLNDASAIFDEMHMSLDYVSWAILLGACKHWGDGELAKKAFNCALGAHGKHATPFILMHNILTDAQM